MSNNILYHAAALKRKIAEAEAEYNMIKEQVLAEVTRLSANTERPAVEVGDFGTFSLYVFRNWKYSPGLLMEEAGIKAMKKQEEADGTAKAVESKVLKFNLNSKL